MRPAALTNYLLRCSSGKVVANNPQRIGVDGSDTEAAWTTALAAHLGGEAEQAIDGVVVGRVDVLTGTQAIELDWLKGNKFHEGIGQALHYGDVTGQQPVLALISEYYNVFGAEQQKLEYVSGLCAAPGVEVWALTARRQNDENIVEQICACNFVHSNAADYNLPVFLSSLLSRKKSGATQDGAEQFVYMHKLASPAAADAARKTITAENNRMPNRPPPRGIRQRSQPISTATSGTSPASCPVPIIPGFVR